jgi:arabinan endo-1,5-alpha-L-arabinosidase
LHARTPTSALLKRVPKEGLMRNSYISASRPSIVTVVALAACAPGPSGDAIDAGLALGDASAHSPSIPSGPCAGCVIDAGAALRDAAPDASPWRADAAPAKEPATYTNPVLDEDFPDPSVLHDADGLYYAFATQGPHGNVQATRSADLVHWDPVHDAMPVKPSWAAGTQNFWAPHVIATPGHYHMYFASDRDGASGKCLGVATAAQPGGPYVATAAPLICGDGFTEIDPMVMDDPASGRAWLYWGSGFKPIRVQELSADREGFAPGSSPVALVSPSSKPYQNLVEGPWVTARDGAYYLYFSGDDCCGSPANGNVAHYAVMVARSASPTGPFELPGPAADASLVLRANARWDGPGHTAIVRDAKGDDWLVYHAIDTGRRTAGGALRRPMLIDRIVRVNGWPTVAGGTPSTTMQTGPAL